MAATASMQVSSFGPMGAKKKEHCRSKGIAVLVFLAFTVHL
jgi:hypothetical protein